jgi:hypothetical protein
MDKAVMVVSHNLGMAHVPFNNHTQEYGSVGVPFRQNGLYKSDPQSVTGADIYFDNTFENVCVKLTLQKWY